MDDSTLPPAKKRKLNDISTNPRRPLTSLDAPISPPPRRNPLLKQNVSSRPSEVMMTATVSSTAEDFKIIPSPFQLTSIQDLPPSLNSGAVTLKDLLGDPLIKECWNFNYLHDIEFLLSAFDPDVKDLINVKVVHGFWKKEDENTISALKAQASAHANVKLLPAYLPDQWGTHHSKMLILIRHDDSAQVIIHTANMVPFDWTNMSQAVWKSPLLPRRSDQTSGDRSEPRGSGSRFKFDLLNYLRAYNTNRSTCKPLITELEHYDFSAVRGALVASVPCKQVIDTDDDKSAWGWPGLKEALRKVPDHFRLSAKPEVVAQVSSISTLSDNQIDAIKDALLTGSNPRVKPAFKVIFPTADEIRRSLNGYASGNAIHTKMGGPGKTVETVAKRAKQLSTFLPMLNQWAGDRVSRPDAGVKEAGRRRAAPHIKTYVRFTDSSLESIDWALVTSANLSNQAWGGASRSTRDVYIQSYEIGVLVWPELFGSNAKMVPTFKTDNPKAEENKTIVGFRMPYDVPLVPYGKTDKPFVATQSYDEFDWRGVKSEAWPEK